MNGEKGREGGKSPECLNNVLLLQLQLLLLLMIIILMIQLSQ
jgi:hypothetical protein